ncbi:MAG: hypothetical protein A3B91_03755 [Candidatus Yanofskybacteria bacterium RIFCSPHIGHO2_02_FULL_41_29]|uniref:Uncharacterized protein n=1 Tax=Candidatus Yanofskybacteria bacterium RIFCSPHIGHO2_01_FULL_41_53 TaxID=1802663 RepID=A0A1F8EKJ4_9BACT|nr:MAG: hypothetical protein A2650_00590 [Candidatus Yanofskybacteria bacterium RIFCSPHIGHO2_01_FULL_41_53]OGN10873.1 MAG: hypothetical protein A3B91_03755 [Candidatus Yanofskybacteria bacterium RIFCSPHIGHO2_02_FULL_41_29]OGN17857.1 MAG: hypothetical protein A3F48_03380 [Candidatus Yanofskybacteria bacterium RIFCSPHIGHO2_12_FULL_41_9]OGN24464.1 MAG: hypothetical protein A2916_02425 [Candidatus Yanofskybacteria bacterium RIFCSPLOWO2_01_FULL_41_67]OGN29542.1 MAG: hypothetical protein A3H54_01395 
MSNSKQKLIELQKEDKYLFHGSPAKDIKELEPRQSYTIPKGKTEPIKDGPSSVSATPYLEVAIFRAIVVNGRSSFSVSANTIEDAVIKFTANQEAIEDAKNRTSYIYVLDRKDFTPRTGNAHAMEWICENPVKPISVFEVNFSDLSSEIEII